MRPLLKIPVINGLIAGALGAALLIILYYLGRHPFVFPVYADFRILLFGIFIYFTLREIRDHKAGILYFWQGMIAALIFLTAYAVVASSVIVIFAIISPAFVQDYIKIQMENLRSIPADMVEKMGKQVVDSNIALLPSTTALDLGVLYMWQCFLLGIFVSVILSVLLRRQPGL